MKHAHNLSKSRYVQGIQCPKILWLRMNEPEEAAADDDQALRRFEIGRRVGEWAQKLFPEGVLVAEGHTELEAAKTRTREYVEAGAPAIFEATVDYHSVLCRADIFKRVNGGKDLWDIYEVKSSTAVKPQYIPDLAVQRYCFEGAGYPIRRTFLMHVDNTYVRNGDIEPDKLLTAEDVTDEVTKEMEGIEEKIEELLEAMNGAECPAIETGAQCKKPYACAFYEYCNEPAEKYSIYDLHRGHRAVPTLEASGIAFLKDVPDDFSLSYHHRQQVLTSKTKQPAVNREAIREHLDMLVYPLYFFDFETAGCGIPLFDNSRPYQQAPFQFSLHIQQKPGGPCEHVEFLSKGSADPREELVKAMLTNLGTEGSIIAYVAGFEQSKIAELARDFPHYQTRLEALLPRFWDLHTPFRRGDYAHYDFRNSTSLKAVLPVLAPSLSYHELDIREGATASLKAELWYGGEMEAREWEKTCDDLLKYCKLDTWAMVEILKVLQEAVR